MSWWNLKDFGKGGIDWAAARDVLDTVIETVGSSYGISISMDELRNRFRNEGIPEDAIDGLIDSFLSETGMSFDNSGNSIMHIAEQTELIDVSPVNSNMLLLGIGIIALFLFIK